MVYFILIFYYEAAEASFVSFSVLPLAVSTGSTAEGAEAEPVEAPPSSGYIHAMSISISLMPIKGTISPPKP